jgi:hypothetical protein
MALIHKATLRPTKLELLAGWLPGQDWHTGGAGELTQVAAYRFDDPAGEVGIETLLVRAGDGPVYQVPLTYRGAPVSGRLLGTAEHSVLGKRWVYDGTGDPVYVAVLASAILANTGQAEEFIQDGDRLEPRPPSMSITSGVVTPTGATVRQVADAEVTRIVTDTVELTVVRRLGTALTGTVLSGTWPGQATPLPLASATLR